MDVDVGSSRAANSVVGMVQGATNHMIIDMAVVLEGHKEEELPEALLGTVRFSNLDMKVTFYLILCGCCQSFSVFEKGITD